MHEHSTGCKKSHCGVSQADYTKTVKENWIIYLPVNNMKLKILFQSIAEKEKLLMLDISSVELNATL